MQEAKKMANRILAEKMIEKLKLRRMEGFYVETKEEALALVKENFLTQGKSVCYGGSVTLQETKSLRCNRPYRIFYAGRGKRN